MDVKTETSELPPNLGIKKVRKIEDLKEDDKGQWVELTNDELKNQMSGLMGYMRDKEFDIVDWDALNFGNYGADYYKETFPWS